MRNSKWMNGVYGALCFMWLFAGQCAAQKADYNAIVNTYIEKYKDIAVKEMMVYKVPASITLAQGILESNAGRSDLAVKANNHFGIKCHKEWTGKTFYKDDETKNECFRKYDSPLESFRDHSWFLSSRDRYKSLFNLDLTDYKGWANGLKSAGYATNPAYAQLLIKTIETFLLFRFDRGGITGVTGDSTDVPDNPDSLAWLNNFKLLYKGSDNRNVFTNNGLMMIVARQDDNLYLIAHDVNQSVSNLLEYNDLPYATAMKPGQIIYLESKRRKGSVKSHRFMSGESIYTISQLYGIKLRMIYKRNDLREGFEPQKGTILRLR